MGQKNLKTDFQRKKEARELAIYNEYNELAGQPGAMKTAVTEHLMKKYGIHAQSTIWFIRKRVEERLATKDESQ